MTTLADLLGGGPVTRRVYFSFHYDNDKLRADLIKGAWDLPGEREGNLRIHDGSLEELAKKKSELAIKRAINGGMVGTSVCCVLVGDETWNRRWCRYEAFDALYNGKGLLAVHVKSLPSVPVPLGLLSAPLANPFSNLATLLGSAIGPNPFDHWGHVRPTGHQKLYPAYLIGQHWVRCALSDSVALSPMYWSTYIENSVYPLNNWYPIYDWANSGKAHLPSWVHTAAAQARR